MREQGKIYFGLSQDVTKMSEHARMQYETEMQERLTRMDAAYKQRKEVHEREKRLIRREDGEITEKVQIREEGIEGIRLTKILRLTDECIEDNMQAWTRGARMISGDLGVEADNLIWSRKKLEQAEFDSIVTLIYPNVFQRDLKCRR